MSGTSQRTVRDAWVLQVFGLDPAGAPAAGTQQPNGQDGAKAWQDARSAAVASLDQLASAIGGMKDPLADKAIILVRSIAKNLTAAPTTRKQVDELRRYLQTDSVIDDAEVPNGFGIEVRLREPLLGALDAVERGLPDG